MGVGEPRGGVGNDEIAGERELQPAGEADAMDRRDDRLAQQRQAFDDARLVGGRLVRRPA